MIRVLSRFFEDLAVGDPVALTVAGILGGILVVALLIWWKIARDLHREDEERKNRWRKKD
jgi:hypothetical protein